MHRGEEALEKQREREREKEPRIKAAGRIPPCLAGLEGLPLQSRVEDCG